MIRIFAIAIAAMLSACGTLTASGDSERGNLKGDLLTLTPGVDGTAVTVVAIDFKEIDPATGKALEFQGYDAKGNPIGGWRRQVKVSENTPTGSKVIEAVAATATPKFIEGRTLRSITGNSKCPEGATACNGTVILNNPQAVATTSANAGNVVDLGVKVGTCTKDCLPGD